MYHNLGRMSILGVLNPSHNIYRTYAVGVLCLRQSGALLSNRVRFFRAPRGKTAHVKMKSTVLPKAQHANGVSPTVIDTTYAITH